MYNTSRGLILKLLDLQHIPLIHISILAAQNRVKNEVIQIKRIHNGDSLGSKNGQKIAQLFFQGFHIGCC